MTISSGRPRLGVPRHLEGLREAMVAFVRYADRAGLRAPVPTTPDWTVRRLVAHQGMVHRWASATVRGLGADPDALEQEGIDA
ncbi:MAG TPA: maleylpyruvate isomerase N-terminal domain-containing protein, partial [Acidimicrobiales bacterium]